jgi:hypothetical protein
MSEVNIYQQRRFLLASAMINTAIGLLEAGDPDILDEVNFDEILEVQAVVVGLLDSRIRNDLTAIEQTLAAIDPDAIVLSEDVVGTEFEEQGHESWQDDNYWDSVRANLDPETGKELE